MSNFVEINAYIDMNISRDELLRFEASSCHERGWIPIALRGGADGKKPAGKWTTTTLENCMELERFPKESDQNIGIRTGEVSGLIVVDVDKAKPGETEYVDGLTYWKDFIEPKLKEFPATRLVQSGGGGLHYYYKYEPRLSVLRNKARLRLEDGSEVTIDIRTDGGYIVAPPSIHVDTGKQYTLLDDAEVQPMPEFLIDFLWKGQGGEEVRGAERVAETQGVGIRFGDMVTIDGEEREINSALIREVLSFIPCPTEPSKWGGYFRDLRSLCEDKSREIQKEVYEVVDEWCKGDPANPNKGYNAFDNMEQWNAGGATGYDFRVLIGMAVNNGLKRQQPNIVKGHLTNPAIEVYFEEQLIAHSINRTTSKDDILQTLVDTVGFIAKDGLIITKTKNQENNVVEFELFEPRSFEAKYDKFLKFKFGGKKVNITTLISRNMGLVVYSRLTFMPYRVDELDPTPENVINLFPGFTAKPNASGKGRAFFRHLKEVICSDDETIYQHILKWFSFQVQFPGVKPKLCPIFKSREQQVGKNLLLDFFGEKILGKALYLCTTSIDSVVGQFNSLARARKLIVLNEADQAGEKWHSAAAQLKGVITDTMVTYNEKCKAQVHLSDYAAYAICTNKMMPAKIETGDSRFFVIDVSDKYKGNSRYFDEIVADLSDPEAPGAVLHDLMNIDLTGYKPQDCPETQAKKEMMIVQAPNEVLFILEQTKKDKRQYWHLEELYKDYQLWCNTNGEERKILSKRVFASGLRETKLLTTKKVRNGNKTENMIEIPDEGLKYWRAKYE